MKSYVPRREAGKASTGCIIAAVVGGLVAVVGALVAIFVLGAGVYFMQQTPSSPSSASGPTSSGPTSAGSSKAYEKPSPTAAQEGAVDGGERVTWSAQGLEFDLPARWQKQADEKTSFSYSAPGFGAHLIVSVSPMTSDFPVDTSLDAFFTQAEQRLKNGEVRQVKRLELDGVKGIQFYEDTPSNRDDPQRLHWLGYRTYLGQTQMINIILSTKGSDSAKFEDALYGILYSARIPH